MPLYTFYPTRSDGLAASFETFELADDEKARLRADRVLEEHRSAIAVVAYCGHRKVLTRQRKRVIADATEAAFSDGLGSKPGALGSATDSGDGHAWTRQPRFLLRAALRTEFTPSRGVLAGSSD